MKSRFLPLLFVACLSLPAFAQTTATAATAAATAATTEFFNATLAGLDSQPQALAQWRGKPLIVNFWARWCGPCRAEIPELVKLRERFGPQGLEVIGIGVEDNTETVRDFVKAYDMSYPVLLDKGQALNLMRALGNAKMGLPFTVAIDRSGKLVVVKMGGIKGDELVAAAEAALKPH